MDNRAVELVAGAFLAVAFEKIFERLASRSFANFLYGRSSIDGQLGELSGKLRTASLVLDDAEDRQIREPIVNEWLADLKDVVFKIDDLVEDINAEARAAEQEHDQSGSRMSVLNKFVFNSPSKFERTLQAKIAEILKEVSDLLERAVHLDLKHGSPKTTISSLGSSAPVRADRNVHGRDADREKIWALLLTDHVLGNQIGALPIVGMGGLGKTTLAHLVYNDNRVKEHKFGLKAWVTVTIEFDRLRILNSVLQQVKPETTRDIADLGVLQQKLTEALRGRKFLFVLDDFWDEDYGNWDFLKSNFAHGDPQSRIIVTTRSRKVASNVNIKRVHELQEVSKDDCWKIFVDHAFDGDSKADPYLQKIGRRIVEKCKGFPLAVISVAGLLRSERNPGKWKSVLGSHVWEWSNRESKSAILPSLWLSYRLLPSPLKHCFAYCSIFPKDYEFEKEKLILLWMAEGFLQSDHEEKSMEEVGEQYFDELISRSLFRRSSRDQTMYVMHDLVHDLAVFVLGKFCFRLDEKINMENISNKTRYLSGDDFGALSEEVLSKATHLRTFVGMAHSSSYYSLKSILEAERCLRVLSPSRIRTISKLPDSFCNLKHLRFLNLSGSDIETMPSSICALYNLQTLLLSDCRRLALLPADMGRLINLRHLDTTGSPLKEMPPHMAYLKQLRTLTDFVLGEQNTGSSIKELGTLQNLSGKLRISELQNIDGVEDVRKANLRGKANLRELALQWRGDSTDMRRERKVLNALRPHTNLMMLHVCGYAASSFPDWFGDSSFSKMVSVHLSGNGNLCRFLPPLGQLPSLRELVIKGFHGVNKIGSEFYGNYSSITPFQSLETLKFSEMQSWEEWSFVGRDGKDGRCFPSLKKLYLHNCLNLAGSLPECEKIETLKISNSFVFMESLPLDHFPNLKQLKLHGCENLHNLVAQLSDKIETLDISGCNKLEFQRNHRFESANLLRISRCYSLESIALDYFPRLKWLALEECQNLESLTFAEETGTALSSLCYLTVTFCEKLRSLPKRMRWLLPALTHMTLTTCPEIESFPEGGLPSSLKQLQIWDCNKLIAQSRHWNLQQLTSLTSLSITCWNTILLDSFPEGLLPISLTCFSLLYLPHLKSLNGSAFQHITSLEELSLSLCSELQILPEEVLPTSLHSLEIYGCPFLERKYRRKKGEDWHKISHIPRITINGNTTSELDRREWERNRTEDYATTDVQSMSVDEQVC